MYRFQRAPIEDKGLKEAVNSGGQQSGLEVGYVRDNAGDSRNKALEW